ncbi:topoisomerase II [Denitrificimonas caeni]|uniref:topoisomerase II n=1 Tax=Denitrificimonas caeni TaxID=521720 RepID=UPI001963A913|nr:topoisomerase II [Denitrificimonas caeni]
MNTELQLILENEDGAQTEASCTRFAVLWQGKEIWIQTAGNGQLLIGVDVEEGDAEYANLLLRPLATNLVSLQLEMEAADVGADEHVHTDTCDH